MPVDWNFELAAAEMEPEVVATDVDPAGRAWGYGLRDGYQVLKIGESDAREFIGREASATEITFIRASGAEHRAVASIGIPYILGLTAVGLLHARTASFVFR